MQEEPILHYWLKRELEHSEYELQTLNNFDRVAARIAARKPKNLA